MSLKTMKQRGNHLGQSLGQTLWLLGVLGLGACTVQGVPKSFRVGPEPTPAAPTEEEPPGPIEPPSIGLTASVSVTRSGQTATFSATGGTAPYQFSVTAGASTIGSVTGVLTASARVETVRVRVTDANGFGQDASLLNLGAPALWLRPESLTLDGSRDQRTVVRWRDESGHDRHATNERTPPRFVKSGAGDLPAVEFDGEKQYLTLGANYVYAKNYGFSAFSVLRSFKDSARPYFLMFGDAEGEHYGFAYDVDTVGIATPGAHGGANSCADGKHGFGKAPVLYTGEIIFGAQQRVRINGDDGFFPAAAISLRQLTASEIAEAKSRAKHSGPVTLGMKSSLIGEDSDFSLYGEISEILLYDDLLLENERDLVESYLNEKYSLY
ncbi:MAG: hypothetical protein AB7P04_01740 [Bacteriovoracia bacterium]